MITSHLRRRNPSIITLSNIKEIGNQVNYASILKQILVETFQITTYLPCASTFSKILEQWRDQLASVYRFAHLRSLFICTLLVSAQNNSRWISTPSMISYSPRDKHDQNSCAHYQNSSQS
jgi:hypothetical protein